MQTAPDRVTVDIQTAMHSDHVLVRLASVSKGMCASVNLVCIIDVSGSMGAPGTVKDRLNNTLETGLSVLDVIRHAMNTIVRALQPNDSLAIVCYSDDARVALPLTAMDAAGAARACSAIEGLAAGGMTNIWAGLECGLELLRTSKVDSSRISSIFLFTDGVRNTGPDGGDVQALLEYKKRHAGLRCVINTFGFGCSLESGDLDAMARIGCGSFAYIPDSGFTGTVFVNALANLLSTTTKNTMLAIKPVSGAQIALNQNGALPGGFHIINSQQAASANASLLVSIPNLRVGQSLDLIVPVRNIPSSSSEPLLEILVRYKPWNSDRFEAVEAVVSVATVSASIAPAEVSSHIQRLLFVDEIRSCLADAVGSNPPPAEQILQRIDRLAASIDPEIHKDLLVDLRGETRLALAQDNINRWGRHYLLGLTNAHALQLCTNFKDPGLQSYGGQLFSDLRTSFSAIFTKMKPPLTAKMAANRKARTPGVLELMVAETVDAMASFFSPVQACFAGNTLVLLANGSQRCISDLARGDVVATNASLSSTARVCCLVKTPCSSGMADLVTLDGGLRITPYHPVQQSGKWAFPCSIAEPASVPCYAVYNLVLDSNHTIIANGHATVTLGHGVANDPVASHPYFGTRAVVDDLECMRGWSSGTVVLAGVWRDDLTGLVCGLCEAEQDHDSHQADALAAVSSAPAAVVVC